MQENIKNIDYKIYDKKEILYMKSEKCDKLFPLFTRGVKIKTLKDVLPCEVISGEYEGSKFLKYLNYKVLEEINDDDQRFPFTHKNIYVWME